MGEISEWRQSLPKTVLLVLGSLAFVVLGGVLALGFIEVERYDPWVTRIVGWVCALFFLLALVAWTRRLFLGNSVVIRVDEKGIHDLRLSREPIPWEHIKDLRVTWTRQVGHLRLDMSRGDKERFLRPMARLLYWPNRMPAIPTVGLEPSFQDLLLAVERSRPQEQGREPHIPHPS
ncbi:STM3941 family protein [Nonomuraea sp. SYSU D8015]|uniref:STM3941 family protein n=1 Tax=Nonomuraea sp. SYSU D8015 TaxID=2593644 RepID=UPI0016613723|nr:STM3941 family protein [Nonomuraea sp. SYSU D8015]